MKGNRAAHFTDWTMRLAQQMGSLPWATWADFRLKFICDFCPKNKVQMAHMDLETSKYHQGSCSVDEYVNKFCGLVDHAEYTEGTNIVLKFQHGLSPIIQNYIACLTYGRPSDDTPKDWYNAAILCNENCIANSVFQSTLRSTWTTAITRVRANCNPVAGVTKPVHSAPTHATAATPSTGFTSRPPQDPNAMDVDVTQRWGLNPVVCYQCEKTGHTRPNCPEAFNVHTMTVEECSNFIQCTGHSHNRHWLIGRGRGSCTRRDLWRVGFYVPQWVNSTPLLWSKNPFAPLFINENIESNSSYSPEPGNDSSAIHPIPDSLPPHPKHIPKWEQQLPKHYSLCLAWLRSHRAVHWPPVHAMKLPDHAIISMGYPCVQCGWDAQWARCDLQYCWHHHAILWSHWVSPVCSHRTGEEPNDTWA